MRARFLAAMVCLGACDRAAAPAEPAPVAAKAVDDPAKPTATAATPAPTTAAPAKPATSASATPAKPATPTPTMPAAAPSDTHHLVGVDAIAAWDALPEDERARVRSIPTLFLHQSVGQDLEDGAKALGFPFEYYGPNQASVAAGLNGGIFVDVGGVSNGDAAAKLAVWREHTGKHAALKVAMMKFGYADVLPESLEAAKSGYRDAVAAIRARGTKVVHVTPPLVFDTAENPAKQTLRAWMLASFPDDVIFDLTDLESTDPSTGARCEVGGVWRICPSIRSREGCASEGQGIDGPGQGHLCAAEAARLAKAMLFAIRAAAQ